MATTAKGLNIKQYAFTTLKVILFFLLLVTVSLFALNNLNIYLDSRKVEPNLYSTTQYNIIFLSNNLFYFCKLEDFNSEFLKCNDPYYLVRRKEGTDTQEKVYVTKPSDEEIYQPDGSIYLQKSNIVYIAKVGDKSAVMDYINKQK